MQNVGLPRSKETGSSEFIDYERLEAFIACTGDAVLAFDTEGLLTFWNKSAERIFGYSAEEAIGKSYTLIAEKSVHAFQHRIFRETIKGDSHQWYDTKRRRKDGAVIDCAITTSPLMIDGKIVGLVAVVRDITEKVLAAERLKESLDRLDVQAKELAALNAQLEATAEDKRNFVNMVLHDLRHPLTTIQIVLYMLRKADENDREEHISVIEGRVAALVGQLNELAEYHKIEAGRAELHLEDVDLHALIRQCVANHQPALIGDHVAMATQLDPNLRQVLTDRTKLTHIVLNLLSNALKFTPKGTVSISAFAVDGDRWCLVVEDTGIGMKPRDRDRAFEDFFQEQSEISKKRGLGLGLSIAKRLCQSLSGDMELQSQFGSGTRFKLTFPLILGDPTNIGTVRES